METPLAKTIDHALLRPEFTGQEVIRGCALARGCDVFSVCVKPCHIQLAVSELKGSEVLVGTVIGFPHGGQSWRVKVFEASHAISEGADELDMVINIAALIEGAHGQVEREIRSVVGAADGKLVKVILETSFLSDGDIRIGCGLAEAAGARFVKTSTGFSSAGATVRHVALMRETVGPSMQVKASGGIRSKADAVAMIEAGATRLGTTATLAILSEKGGQGSGSY
jgi:deoxyribose-phosphate aldolase